MGMAASQARYLALVARQSNCEYEGQQINQARLNLSNQTANLFNQMLGLEVPIPPSTTDYTKKQYSFTDGINKYTIDRWNQLAEPDSEGYNYVVTYHYNSDVYTGYQKQKSDPQVQFTYSDVEVSPDYRPQIDAIQKALVTLSEAQEVYDTSKANYQTLINASKNLITYTDKSDYKGISKVTFDENTNIYTITSADQYLDPNTKIRYDLYKGSDRTDNTGTNYYYKDRKYYYKDADDNYKEAISLTAVLNDDGTIKKTQGVDAREYDTYTGTDGKEYYYYDNVCYDQINDIDTPHVYDGKAAEFEAQTKETTFHLYTSADEKIKNALNTLKERGAIDSVDTSTIFVSEDGQSFAYKSDIEALVTRTGVATILPVYNYDKEPAAGDTWKSVEGMEKEISDAETTMRAAKSALDLAQLAYDSLNVPSYVGNCKLTPLSELTDAQVSEIKQIMADMDKDEISTHFTECFSTLDGIYNNDTYTGGIYTFELNGVTYLTTYYDLADSIRGGEGINHIDNQPKLPYYAAEYMTKSIDKTSKALLETDSSGRFTSIRFEDDSIKYTLNVETITDDLAYQDAMNQYYYESARYDKMVQDINAKTSIIQQEDQELELRLKQLDTERNALTTEIEAVQKVIKDNVDKSFKTFSG